MQVANIECQIAQAQLRRYLTGEEMPNSIVTELEQHLRLCPECMTAAQTLRSSLQGVLQSKITGKPTAKPAVAPSTDATEPAPVGHALVETPADLLDAPDDDFKPKKATKSSNLKTLAYSGALALLLVLMSTVFKNPTTLFGPKAAAVTQDTPPAVDSTPETEPAEAKSEPVVTDPQPLGPVEEPEATQEPKTEEPKTDAPANKPLETSGLILADGTEGNKTVKQPDKPKTSGQKPRSSGNGTIKVYPPDN